MRKRAAYQSMASITRHKRAAAEPASVRCARLTIQSQFVADTLPLKNIAGFEMPYTHITAH